MSEHEHDCEHHTRFISYPDAGKGTHPFCALCEIERLRSRVSELSAARAAAKQIQLEWEAGITEADTPWRRKMEDLIARAAGGEK